MIAPLQSEIERGWTGYVFGPDEATPASAVHALLRARGAGRSPAESCTGGRLAAALTAVPGSSQTLLGGVVAYGNAVKVAQLGVAEATLASDGAVSEAIALADGTRRARASARGPGPVDDRHRRPERRHAGEARRHGLVRPRRRRRAARSGATSCEASARRSSNARRRSLSVFCGSACANAETRDSAIVADRFEHRCVSSASSNVGSALGSPSIALANSSYSSISGGMPGLMRAKAA